jgi:glycosyltransferase involved in cell wall biosynthesis
VPPVAIVVTTHDYGAYLEACLRSLAAQTRRPDEVLVVDDASTDDTPAVLDRVLPSLGLPVRVVRQDTRRGFVTSLNEGIRATTAPYVAHVDADDTCAPRYVDALADALDAHPAAGYAYPRMRLVGAESGLYATYPFDPARLLWAGNYIPNVGLLRRAAFDATPGYRELPTHVDWDLWLAFLEAGWPGVLVDEVLYDWHRHPGAMTYQPSPVRLRARLDILWAHRALWPRYGGGALPWTYRAVRRRFRPDPDGLVRTASGWVSPG